MLATFADLLAHGLIRSSFVPEQEIQELRELLRTRKQLGRQLRGRRGPKKAACAVAASLLTTIYHMLTDGTQFQDLGADHFDHRSKDARAKRLVTQLAKLGFDAKLTPLAQAA
jgi:hypothetical protein